MANIIHISGEVQLNTPYSSDEELHSCGLSDWRIATDVEVNSFDFTQYPYLKQIRINTLQASINDLDFKCIRAIRELTIKDESTGQTWLEYYNEQIIALRDEIVRLQQ